MIKGSPRESGGFLLLLRRVHLQVLLLQRLAAVAALQTAVDAVVEAPVGSVLVGQLREVGAAADLLRLAPKGGVGDHLAGVGVGSQLPGGQDHGELFLGDASALGGGALCLLDLPLGRSDGVGLGVVGDGLRGGYEDWDMPSDIAAYVPCATCSETNSEFLMPPILPFMASSYDLLGNENFSGNIAIRGDGTLMYSNKEGFGKGLSWRNGKVLKNTSLGKVACKTTRMAKGAPALSIVTGTVDVTLNARQYGFGSRQTYGAFGRAAGGILASIGTGFLIGGGLPGAVAGFAVGIGASYGGEWFGKLTFDLTH